MTPKSCKANSISQSCDGAFKKASLNKSSYDSNFNILKDYLNDWGDSRRLNRWYEKLPNTAKHIAGKAKKPILRP